MTVLGSRTILKPFPTTVLVAIVFKLWLTADIRTVPILAPHDASNFLEHARKLIIGHWFGGYTDLTLIKGPFFPIYLAIVHDFGISLTTAHVLFNAIACTIACIALRPVIARDGVLASLFLLLFFNPFTYNADAWLTMRSQINPDLALICIACAMGMLLRKQRQWPVVARWSMGLGIAFSAFWLTREEAIWLVPALLIVLLPYVSWSAWRWGSGGRQKLLLALLPVVLWFAAVNIVATINGRVYGWRTVTEMQAPEFESAYSSLERLDPEHVDLRVAVSRLGRERAYRVSANARALRPQIEGGVGNNWRLESCRGIHICNEIAAPLFSYALRDAVAFTGNANTGGQARTFYATMAAQIDAACDRHIVPCDRKRSTFLPAGLAQHADGVISNFIQGLNAIVTLAPLNMSPPPYTPPSTSLRTDYEDVVRSVDIRPGVFFSGWLIHKPLRSIAVTDPSPTDDSVITFHPSPDVAQVFGPTIGKQGYETANVRFEISSSCIANCALVITTLDGHISRIPLAPNVVDFRNSETIYHLDASATVDEDDFDRLLRTRVIDQFAQSYRRAMPALLALTVVLVLLRLLRVVRGSPLPNLSHLLVGVLISAGGLVAILAIIELFGVGAFNSEYMGPIFILTFFVIGATMSAEGILYYRWFRRVLARRWRSSPLMTHTAES